MPEIRDIVALHQQSSAAGIGVPASSVLLTLVRVIGSSYRRPGAHLLTTHAGAYAGLVSGGCLEAEVLRKAEWMIRDGAIVTRYSTLFDETSEMPFGLGCGGEVDLLLEPASTPEFSAWLQAAEDSLQGHSRLCITLLPDASRPIQRIVFDLSNRCIYKSHGITDSNLAALKANFSIALATTNTGCMDVVLGPTETPRSVFVEWLHPPQRLFVFGAGKDAQPLVNYAAQLGWQINVADGRIQFLRPELFPLAVRVELLPPTGDPIATLSIMQQDAAVIMTHSYEQDRRILQALLLKSPRYIGLLGARQRSAFLIRESAAALGRTVDDCLAQVHAPVGLDLGSDAPESIALSIVAEIQAHLHGRAAGMRTAALINELGTPGPAQPILCRPHFEEP